MKYLHTGIPMAQGGRNAGSRGFYFEGLVERTKPAGERALPICSGPPTAADRLLRQHCLLELIVALEPLQDGRRLDRARTVRVDAGIGRKGPQSPRRGPLRSSRFGLFADSRESWYL